MGLKENPFYILGASPRDNRAHIMELAEERSLTQDTDTVAEARSILTNPRKRLQAEVAWFPGISPRSIKGLLETISSSPENILHYDNCDGIAYINLLVAGIENRNLDEEDAANYIEEIVKTFDDIEPEKLLETINEDRAASGFPEVIDVGAIEEALRECRGGYRQSIMAFLREYQQDEKVSVITEVVDYATSEGEDQAPVLLSDLVDAYEVDVQEALRVHEERINQLVSQLRVELKNNKPDNILNVVVGRLIISLKEWDRIVQPIQVVAKSQGQDHEASILIAHEVRNLAIDMFNEYDKLDLSQKLIKSLAGAFAEVSSISERVDDDITALSKIATNISTKKANKVASVPGCVWRWGILLAIGLVIWLFSSIGNCSGTHNTSSSSSGSTTTTSSTTSSNTTNSSKDILVTSFKENSTGSSDFTVVIRNYSNTKYSKVTLTLPLYSSAKGGTRIGSATGSASNVESGAYATIQLNYSGSEKTIYYSESGLQISTTS